MGYDMTKNTLALLRVAECLVSRIEYELEYEANDIADSDYELSNSVYSLALQLRKIGDKIAETMDDKTPDRVAVEKQLRAVATLVAHSLCVTISD
jgi:Holliday junction resolvasome RuvABC endonuclease subunit